MENNLNATSTSKISLNSEHTIPIEINSNDNRQLEMIMEQKTKTLSTIHKLNSLKDGYLPTVCNSTGKRDSNACDRKVSDFEIKTDNQNSLNVEIDDPDYMNDPMDDVNSNNNFDYEIKEELNRNCDIEGKENDIYANIVINENIS